MITGSVLLRPTQAYVPADCPTDAAYSFATPSDLEDLASESDAIIRAEFLERVTVIDTSRVRGDLRRTHRSVLANVHTMRVKEVFKGTVQNPVVTVAIGGGICLDAGQEYYLFVVSGLATGSVFAPGSVFVDDPEVEEQVADYGLSVYGPSNAIRVSGGKVFPLGVIGSTRYEGAAESQFRADLISAVQNP